MAAATTTTTVPDTLTVYLSGDAYDGDADATLTVNGQPVGSTLDVSAVNAEDDVQAFTFTGDFGVSPQVAVSFTNDLYGGSPSEDRNLYLDGFSYDGVPQLGIKQELSYDQTDDYTLASPPAVAGRAADFMGGMGVNVHLTYTDTSYGNTAEVAGALAYLGDKDLRISIPDIEYELPELQSLAAQGYRFDVLMQSSATDVSLQADVAAIGKIAASVVSVEGPNETNLTANFSFDGQNGDAAAIAYQKALYADVKADASLAGVPVVSFTLAGVGTDAYTALGNVSSEADEGNMHVYYADGTPPASTLQYALGLDDISNPGLPLVITETNYITAPAIQGSVDENVQARYDLDLLMDAAKDGVVSTYLYELLDENADPGDTNDEDHYGLFETDGTPKPAATAIHNLHAILSDTGAAASSFSPGALAYSLSGMPASGDSLLLQKSDGAYDLVLWAEPEIWNAATSAEVASTPRAVTASLPDGLSDVSVYDPLTGASALESLAAVSTVSVSLTDHPVVLQITPATGVPQLPVLQAQAGDQRLGENQAFSFELPANSYSDPAGGTVAYSAYSVDGSPLPSWISFNAQTGIFTGQTPAAPGATGIRVVATTSEGAMSAEAFKIYDSAPAPVLVTQAGDQRVTDGSALSFGLPASSYSDPAGGSVSYTASSVDGSALPPWLTFNPVTDRFSGTAPSSPTVQAVEVVATTSEGASSAEAFHIYTSAAAPVLDKQAPDQRLAAGTAFAFALPNPSFTDPSGGAVTLSARDVDLSALPSWLSFNAATDVFSGTTPTGAGGLGVRVDAATPSGGSGAEAFHMFWGGAKTAPDLVPTS